MSLSVALTNARASLQTTARQIDISGRNIAGVHWRSDAYESLRLGERVAIALLKDHLATFNEGGGCRFTGFDGQTITL